MTCEYCGKGYEAKTPRGRFCCGRCRSAAWQANRVKDLRAALTRVVDIAREALGPEG